MIKNSISALPNSRDLHNRLYDSAKAKFKELLNNTESGNVEIKEEIPSCNGDMDPQDLKIALHMDPFSSFNADSRIVTLRSLTNPSVAVAFNAISSKGSDFTLDDKIFTALDLILRLVPQGFKSIKSYTEVKVGDIDINLDIDNKKIDPFIYTENASGEPTFLPAEINGLSFSKAPKEPKSL
jgi:hypothetical protein